MLRLFLKESMLYSISSWCFQLVGLLLIPYYTRVFAPAAFGAVALLTLVNTIVRLVVSFQVDQSVARYYMTARSCARKKSIATTGLLHFASGFTLIFVVSLVFGRFIARDVLMFTTAYFYHAFLMAILSLLFSSITYYNLNMLKWLRRPYLMAGLSVFDLVLSTTLIVINVSVLALGVMGVFAAQAVSSVVLILLTGYPLRKIYNFKFISKKIWKKMLLFGAPLVPVAVFAYLIQYADRFIITHMLGLTALGLFSVAAKLSNVVLLLMSGLQLAWAPFVYGNYKKPETKKLIADIFLVVIILGGVIIFGSALFALDILKVVASPQYYAAYIVVPILAAVALIISLVGYFTIGIGLAEKNYHRIYIYSIGLAVNVALNIILIPHLGIVGSALATLVASILILSVSLRVSHHYYPITYAYLKAILVAALVATVSAVGLSQLNHNDWSASLFLLKCLIFFVYTAAMLFCLRAPIGRLKQHY